MSSSVGAAARPAVLLGYHLADEPDDDHQDRASDSAAGEVADDRADVDAAAGCGACGGGHAGAAQQGSQDLAPDATADDPGNGVSDRAKVVVLEHVPCDVSPDRA